MTGTTAFALVLSAASELAIPVIVIGEYRFGICRSRYRDQYEAMFDGFLARCRILTVDRDTAKFYAAVRLELREAGTPIPVNDLWIAALCRQHAMNIMSRDTHFDYVARVNRVGW